MSNQRGQFGLFDLDRATIGRYGETLTKADTIKTLFECFDTHIKPNGH